MCTPEVPDDSRNTEVSETYSYRASDKSVRQLADAVARLGADGQFMVDALIETVLSLRPITKSTMAEGRKAFLVESGVFTVESLAATTAKVARGSLARRSIETEISLLVRTLSLEDTCAYLKWEADAVLRAVADGRLYALEIAGRPRFPDWQFHRPSPDGLLPHLAELIALVSARWTHYAVCGFMGTSHSSLVAEGPMRPAEFIIRTGDFDRVRRAIEVSDFE
ncbi:hypothetical protein ITJ57_05620 [Plantibacter sp. VKM Ac-2880]|uniref:hypothetical protein n=1 Tax=Plantibacter sp. VKM Ac-2880 TaxID=2783827 RepID=UPI0018906CE3|nr:hypothetical protein [Plantibacter sp. VKM Ac-2880]MBF4568243.1 hypothetical protein [Plantibacter sp. VKM Ac-2880]